MSGITVQTMVILKSPSRSVSFAVPHNEPNSIKRTFSERGRISVHSSSLQTADALLPHHPFMTVDSLDLKRFQPASDASISIAVLYSGKEGGSNNDKFQTPFLDLNKALHNTLTWSENFTLPDPINFAKPRLRFEIVMSTKNRFLVSKKTVIGRSEPQSLYSLLRYPGEAEISFTMLSEGSPLGPILRIKTRRLAPVPVNIKKVGQ
ncbi:hypothetical protein D9619_002090 [Psilocybe cf. subviscida]|uniref:Uncharacterized protein n=1 Tax=Psilocybe cf. subviscida TaxID=2480587 RepID=A0A8H5BFC5_9AGAR|nr:hypothetical protein D9619_002090 [Psilocybe cf. subviscida]